jgi:hypothetical protein
VGRYPPEKPSARLGQKEQSFVASYLEEAESFWFVLRSPRDKPKDFISIVVLCDLSASVVRIFFAWRVRQDEDSFHEDEREWK